MFEVGVPLASMSHGETIDDERVFTTRNLTFYDVLIYDNMKYVIK
jgi:hypothetical protein